MRTFDFGQYASQWALQTARQIQGLSTVIYGHVSNTDNSGFAPTSYLSVEMKAGGYQLGLWKVDLTTIRGLIGHAPVLLSGKMMLYSYPPSTPGTYTINVYRMKLSPDYTDATGRNRDATGPVRWGGADDTYAPMPGYDRYAVAEDVVAFTPAATIPSVPDHEIELTAYLTECLRRGVDLELFLDTALTTDAANTRICWDYNASSRPFLRMHYLFPIEFYQASAGAIDMTRRVDNSLAENPYYLGALERGETGTAIQGWIKNFSTRTLGLVEIIDDHPEWSVPVQTVGGGTGQLDYVLLANGAVSQLYTVVFSSSTDYEVKAEAYRDYTVSLHATIDADPTWQGDVTTDFTSPDGYLTIPATAWQPGTANNDEFEIYVKGNSSDATWPSDSAEQIEITSDSAGSADAAGWRPINGRRTVSTASVTVDAATKKFPCRAIDASDWIANTPAFIGDGTNLHEGHVESAQEAEIGADVFTGVGLDDITVSGNYNGTWEDDLVIKIDSTAGSPDTFKWSKDGGANWEATLVPCTLDSAPTLLDDGIYVGFAAVDGHTVDDLWTCAVQPFAVELDGLTNDSTVYAAGARIGTSLPISSLGAAVWGTLTAAAGPSEAVENRLYLHGPSPDYAAPATAGFVIAQTVYIVDVADPTTYEVGEITDVQGTYVDLDADLTIDFPEGALVAVVGSGEAPFWLRAAASGSTTEELKQARLAVRV